MGFMDAKGRVVLVDGAEATKPLEDFAMKGEVGIAAEAPASAAAEGTEGQVVVTAGYIYVCVADNTWKRAALSTWT